MKTVTITYELDEKQEKRLKELTKEYNKTSDKEYSEDEVFRMIYEFNMKNDIDTKLKYFEKLYKSPRLR